MLENNVGNPLIFGALSFAFGTVAAAGRTILLALDNAYYGQHQNNCNNGDQNDIGRIHTKPPVTARTIILNRKLTIHASMHCQIATAAAYFHPSSRLKDAIAATQGV